MATVTGKNWDVIVIGTGMGGATAGYALAVAGFSVLFLEKGRSEFLQKNEFASENTNEGRLAQGKWPTPLSEQIEGVRRQFYAPLGCGVGGTTLIFAATMERMERSDFESRHREEDGRESWPLSFEQFSTYYEKAEQLYGVQTYPETSIRSSVGASSVSQNLSAWDGQFVRMLEAKGLHPLRLHLGIAKQQCKECFGRICYQRCKRDARTVCVEPALANPNCLLLDDCEVTSLDADSVHVKEVHAIRAGEHLKFKARIVVLSAGAYFSPVLLLRSQSITWPNGLANSSGMVGRNLMFHASDYLALWAPKRYASKGVQKSLALRDFYSVDGKPLGSMQSIGMDAGHGNIALYLKQVAGRYQFGTLKPVQKFLSLFARLAAILFGQARVFSTITEDYPNPNNRVMLSPSEPSGMHFEYTISPDLQLRVNTLRAKLRAAVSPWRMMPLNFGVTMNFGHPCGTCRMGRDPQTSVVDSDSRAHDLDNLYIVDASFMPTSGAINPSLTIAANALRVADQIKKKWEISN